MNVTVTKTDYGREIVIANPTEAIKSVCERMRQYKAARREAKLRKYQSAFAK